jgi:hypothetical protein
MPLDPDWIRAEAARQGLALTEDDLAFSRDQAEPAGAKRGTRASVSVRGPASSAATASTAPRPIIRTSHPERRGREEESAA